MDYGLRLSVEEHDRRGRDSKSGGTFGFTAQVAFMEHPRATVVLLANGYDVQGLCSLATAPLDILREP